MSDRDPTAAGAGDAPAPGDDPDLCDDPDRGDDPDRVDGVAVPAADHYVYVLECTDGSLYTGYTTDVARRVAEHDAGNGAKYTRGRTPVELVHVEAFDSKSAAMSREYAIKQRSRREKESLVE
ncbi:Predicted endonuclease, GIY-YIG superfamily [Halobaculum gomorrense]|uniref:Predicted endonuclease, GIY-YIG superfamily n=1 Tax=Halobaculum gomorrense TaxID=43928 RepID=A0A1M5QGQ1_9EURY|nr:Predicted endonuclease, GIY-YIG superfamily [Halobaculum gomorrense]